MVPVPRSQHHEILIDESTPTKCLGFAAPVARRRLKPDDRAPVGADFGGGKMRRSISNAVVAALVATVMALCWTSPSLAFGGFHGGFGGFRAGFGGGFHPGFGGFRPGFRPGFVGFHPGFGGLGFSSIAGSSATAFG
jgi:hypothetical protein